jgi:hypothetical protein
MKYRYQKQKNVNQYYNTPQTNMLKFLAHTIFASSNPTIYVANLRNYSQTKESFAITRLANYGSWLAVHG